MENEITYYKQLDDLILDELNVKSIRRYIGDTEKGELYLVYAQWMSDIAEKYYFWELGGVTKSLLDTPGMLIILKNAKIRI